LETNYIFCMNIKFNNEVLSSQFGKQNKYIETTNTDAKYSGFRFS